MHHSLLLLFKFSVLLFSAFSSANEKIVYTKRSSRQHRCEANLQIKLFILFIQCNKIIFFLKKPTMVQAVYLDKQFLNSAYMFWQPPAIIRVYLKQNVIKNNRDIHCIISISMAIFIRCKKQHSIVCIVKILTCLICC